MYTTHVHQMAPPYGTLHVTLFKWGRHSKVIRLYRCVQL